MAQNLISHKEWMKRTALIGRRRSPLLKDLDEKLASDEKYGGGDSRWRLGQALKAWQLSKTKEGKHWTKSGRNKQGAVEELHNLLIGPVDKNALTAVRDELARETANVEAQFLGKQISWKNEFRGKLNSNLVKPNSRDFGPYLLVRQGAKMGSENKFGTLGNSVSGALNTASILNHLLDGIVPSDMQATVMMEVSRLVPNFMSEFVASCAPFAGIITSAGVTLWNVKNTVKSTRIASKAKVNLHQSMAGKSGTAAIESLIEALERERNADIYSMGVSAAELGGKIATLAVDGGMVTNTAISLSANILKLMNIARIVYNDIVEKNAANSGLKTKVDISIFETSPLVGCYWLNIAPQNVMLSGIYDKIGNANWQDSAEDAHKALAPLRDAARIVIGHHRFEIRELNEHPGGMLMKPNLTELSRMQTNIGKSNMVGFGSNA
jgi:hypothetical protein